MSFDWVSFLESNFIEFIDQGPNVGKNNVNIKCPFCFDDPSFHLGINLEKGVFSCWRNPRHCGGSAKLIARLLSITFQEAKEMLDEGSYVQDDILLQRANALFERKEMDNTSAEVKLHFCFKKITPDYLFSDRAFGYLISRKFKRSDIQAICDYYNLRYSNTGKFKQRIIFPYMVEKKIIGWTSRAIVHSNSRYRAYPSGEKLKDYIYNYDNASEGGKVLGIVEGPVDCLKLDYYGRELGVRAAALCGLSISDKKINWILKLSKRFDRVMILLDPGYDDVAIRIASELPNIVAIPSIPDYQAEDLGAMAKEEIISYSKKQLLAV